LVHDVKEMAEAIQAVDTLDPVTCRREAENRFSADRMFEQYLQLYEDVAGGKLEKREERELCTLRVDQRRWVQVRVLRDLDSQSAFGRNGAISGPDVNMPQRFSVPNGCWPGCEVSSRRNHC